MMYTSHTMMRVLVFMILVSVSSSHGLLLQTDGQSSSHGLLQTDGQRQKISPLCKTIDGGHSIKYLVEHSSADQKIKALGTHGASILRKFFNMDGPGAENQVDTQKVDMWCNAATDIQNVVLKNFFPRNLCANSLENASCVAAVDGRRWDQVLGELESIPVQGQKDNKSFLESKAQEPDTFKKVQHWLEAGINLINYNEETITQYEVATKEVAKVLNKPATEITRRDMVKIVNPFAATTMSSFVPLGSATPLAVKQIAKEKNDFLFTSHIWDDTEAHFHKGVRELMRSWNRANLDTYKCVYSNSQFRVAAGGFVTEDVQQSLGSEVIAQNGTGYWSNEIMATVFESLAEKADYFAFFASSEFGTGAKWKWNFGELKGWLNAEKNLQKFGFASPTGGVRTGKAGFESLLKWVEACGTAACNRETVRQNNADFDAVLKALEKF